jgi:hypothetical protein
VSATLAQLGIQLRRPERIGEHRAACPRCHREAPDTALAVRVEPDGGATWHCHRCDWAGGIAGKSWKPKREYRRAPRVWKQEPEFNQTLAAWAREFWASCRPIRPDTVAAAYLDARRCALPPEDGDLKWRPDVPHPSGHVGPCLIGLVTDAESCEPISLHRTWIQPDGSKAQVAKPRLLLAKHRSAGVVRIWGDAEVTIGLTLGEGLESCLSAALDGLKPTWACLSARNLARFPVLPGLEGLTILIDHDKINPVTGKRAGTEAALELINRYIRAAFDPGGDIRVIWPPQEGQDANDLAAGMAL